MSGKLLKEIYEGHCVIVEQEKLDGGKIIKPAKIAGIASRGNVVNENSRYYKTELWQREAKRLQEKIKKGKLLGELDHPDDGKSRLDKTAVKYTKLYMDGDYLKFEGEILDTERGRTLKALLKGGVGIDVSTRGFGSTKEGKVNGEYVKEIVQDDYELTAIDPVAGHSNVEAEINYFQERKNEKGGNDMRWQDIKLEDLKKECPDLVKEIVKETEERVRKEVTDELTENFEQRVLDEISKARDEIVAEVTEQVKSELVPQYEEYQVGMMEILDIAQGLLGEEETGETSNKDEQVRTLETKLDETTRKLTQVTEDLARAQEKIAQGEVKDYLEEKLKNERFKALLKERLSDCKTKQEVDERLPKEKEYVHRIVQESAAPTGKGQVPNEDAQANEQTLDEQKKRQQRLAGID